MSISVSDLTALQAAVASPPSDGVIYLTNNITLSDTAYLNITKAIAIDGQGFSLIVPQDADYGPYSAGWAYTYNFAIYIASGSLTLQNITLDGNQNINSVGAIFGYNGPVTINEGTLITNFSRTVYQGTMQDIVSMRKDLTMNGGSISNNAGRGVNITNSAIFTLNSGTISYNNFIPNPGPGVSYGDEGGPGVTVSTGTFIMNGGLISYNTVATANSEGGGIFLNGAGTINGGTISYNSAYYGGGIYIFSSYGTLTLNGGTIEHNTATAGGGIYSESRASDLICGQISNNQASSSGGGIYLREPGVRIGVPDNCPCQDCLPTFPLLCDFPQICDCPTCQPLPNYCLSIDNNTATNGGGVYAAYGVEINCALITQNNAANGGGIYASSLSQALTVNKTAILCNHSTAGGAGMYLSYMETVLQSCLLYGNVAGTNGGAILIGSSDEQILTTSSDTCFSNNSASAPLFSAQPTPNIQYCCKSLEPLILNNYDIYSSIKNAGQKIPTPNPVAYGQTLTWHTFFTHNGNLSTLTIKDPLTPFTYIANTAIATINGAAYPVAVTGTADNPIFTISAPATAGQLISLTFEASVPQLPQDTTYTNMITLNSSTTATGTVTVLKSSFLSPQDILTKSAAPTALAPGEKLTYTVTLTKN